MTVIADCTHEIPSTDDGLTLEIGASTFLVCQDCADDVDSTMDGMQTCDDCDVIFVPTYDDIALECGADVSLSRYSAITISLGDTESWQVQRGEYETLIGSDREICIECASQYSRCGYCGEYGEDLSYCDSCEESFCEGFACDESHADCAFSGTGGSITESLAAPTRPGNLVRSLRGIGFEVERNCDYSRDAGTAAREMSAAGILLESHGEHCGHEFVLLPSRGQNVENTIGRAFRILENSDLTGTDDCGLHFHLDFTTESREEILRAVAALRIVENVLYALTGTADGSPREEIGFRRRSTWCQPATVGHAAALRDVLRLAERPMSAPRYGNPISDAVSQGGRYCGINTHAYSEHRTIEIRILDAALDSERVCVAAGIAAGVADFGIASTTATLAALADSPLTLLYRAARQGFVSGAALRYAEERYEAFLPVVAAERAAEIRRQEIAAQRRVITDRFHAAESAASAAYDAAVQPFTVQRNLLRDAAESAVQAARNALRAAEDAAYRIRVQADESFTSATVTQRTQRDRDFRAARDAYNTEVDALRAAEAAIPAAQRRYSCCAECG